MIIRLPHWHEQVVEDKKFLSEFIEQVESQISSTIESYEKDRQVHQEEEYEVKFYRGLDSLEYDIHDLFNEYFPNIHRKSALITLYSFLEVKLLKLCEELKRKKSLATDVKKDRSNSIIGHAANYIIDDAQVNWDKSAGVWTDIDNIKALRNRIVHHDGDVDETKQTD